MRPYSSQYASTNKIITAGLVKIKFRLHKEKTLEIRRVEILRYSYPAAETVARTAGRIGTVVMIL